MRTPPRSPRRRVGTVVGLIASTSLVTAGIALTSSAAHAEPVDPGFDACPAAFPASELTKGLTGVGLTTAGEYTKDGQERDSSVTPETFTAKYRGTLSDSLSGDLYVFDLEGSRITKSDGTVDAGVWAGISGSPVYASDGRLIGSVSYTFIDGNTNSAGVTPAEDLYRQRDLSDGGAAPMTLKVSKAEQTKLRKAGASAAVSGDAGGLKRIQAPQVVSGVGALGSKTSEFLKTIAQRSGHASAPLAAGGGSSVAAGPTEIVPGGNVGFADSYGAVGYYSVGTATAVCGDKVVAYGHPNNFAPYTESMHSATATSIQSAAGIGSFKLANLGPALGTQIGDGLNGVIGRLGAVPEGTVVKTTTNGVVPKSSESIVPNPDALSSAVATQIGTELIVSANRYAGGEAQVGWTIHYIADGVTGSITRSNRYSDANSLAEYVGNDVASDVETLQNQSFADVKITRVEVTTTPNDTYRAYRFGKIKVKSLGKWRTLSYDDDLEEYATSLPRGRYFKVRVRLEPAGRSKVAPTFTQFTLKTPSKPALAEISVSGGMQEYWYDDEDFEDYEEFGDEISDVPAVSSFADVLKSLRDRLRSDQVGLSYTLYQGKKHTTTTSKKTVGAVVSGESYFVADIG